MIIGHAEVSDGAVITHRDSFMLSNITAVSVRRPYLAGNSLLALGLGGFALQFGDLLYPEELGFLAGLAASLLVMGMLSARLTLLSRDLRGSELSSAIWGTQGDLHRVRREITAARQVLRSGD